jgi:hypothetical protein
MNPMPCRYEGEMIQALRSGAWPAELERHREECADCRQALALAQALHEDAARLHLHSGPPPAAQIWAAAQRQEKNAALQRAAFVQRVLKIAGWVYAAVFLAWSLRSLPHLSGDPLRASLNGKILTDSVMGAAFAAICVCGGLWYALRNDGLAVQAVAPSEP